MIPSSPCATVETQCDVLHEIALHLLSECFDAVMACYPSDCCDPLAAYVTLGQGDDGQTDALTVAVRTITPSGNTTPGGFALWRCLFEVRLRESGWPMVGVEGDAIVLPTPAEQAIAAQHVFMMGEALHRRLSYLQSHRALVPATVRCTNAVVGEMAALLPQGGVAGWTAPVIVDLPWN